MGIYWLQAASVAAFSTASSPAIWPYRLPSALAATAAVVLTFAFGSRLLASRPAGFIAAVLLACGLGVVAEAHLAKTDAALLAAIVAAQGALGLVYTAGRNGRRVPTSLPLMFWLAEAFAILLKGPAAPVLALLTIASLSIADRDLRWIGQVRPLSGILMVSLIVGPWAVAIESATDGRFISESILRDFLPKLVGAQESHGASPGCYAALVMATFWPGSLLIVPALVKGWRRRRAPVQRFLLAWLVPAWILFELVPTKLPHYVLPLYPALALLSGSAVTEGLGEPLGIAGRFLASIVNVLWGSATVALVAVLIAAPAWFGGGYSPVIFTASAVILGLAALLLLRAWPPFATAGLVAALAAIFVLPAALVVAPELNSLWLSRSAAALVAQHPLLRGRGCCLSGIASLASFFFSEQRHGWSRPPPETSRWRMPAWRLSATATTRNSVNHWQRMG